MNNDRFTVLWVENWPLKEFFLNRYLSDAQAQSREEKMEVVWALTQKMLLAREALANHFQADEHQIQQELENLMKKKEIKENLRGKNLTPADLELFLKVEALSKLFTAQVEKQVQDYLNQHPAMIQDFYEKNKPAIPNAHRLAQVSFKSPMAVEGKQFSEDEVINLGGTILDLGVFSEEEIARHYPQDEYPILGKPAGSLIEAALAEQDAIYYWIREIVPELVKDFKEIKQDFENFVLSYMIEETLSDLYNELMDRYEIRYNENFFDQLMQE